VRFLTESAQLYPDDTSTCPDSTACQCSFVLEAADSAQVVH
jgi:hypothetical protein